MELIKKYWKYITAFIAIFLFLIIVEFYYQDKLYIFDNFVYNYVKNIINNPMTIIMKFITFFASPLWCIVLAIIIIIFNKKLGKYFSINLALVFLLNFVLKLVFARERPIDINIITESGYSFPSGHSMVSAGMYGFLAYNLWKSKIKNGCKVIGFIGLVILTFLIGLSRIYLGVHYTSDVIGGFVLGIAYLVLFIQIVYSKKLTNK